MHIVPGYILKVYVALSLYEKIEVLGLNSVKIERI